MYGLDVWFFMEDEVEIEVILVVIFVDGDEFDVLVECLLVLFVVK